MADGTDDAATASTADFLAGIAAAEAGGTHPLAFEAQKLVLDSRAVGGVDAAKLVQRLRASPAFVPGRKQSRPLIDEIESRLDPIAARRFERELDRADITDTRFERAVEKTGGGLFGIGRFLDRAVHWIDDHVRDAFDKAHKWVERVSHDPQANPLLRLVAGVADAPIRVVETAYSTVSAPVLKVTRAVENVAEIGNFAYRVASRHHYRDALFAMGELYLIESADKVSGRVVAQAQQALGDLETGLIHAVTTGKQTEFLAGMTGRNGLDLFTGILPTAAFNSLDHLAGTLDRLSLDQVDELRQALAHAGDAMARGGAAGEAGESIWRNLMRDFRDDGTLPAFVDMARESGRLDLMLKLGELSPKELSDLLQRDPTLFRSDAAALAADGAVPGKASSSLSFDDALAASIARLDPTKLDARGADELAEAIMTRDLLRGGYTDIAAIATRDGITLAGRDADGRLARFDADAASIAAAVKALPVGAGAEAVDRLAALIDTDARLKHGARDAGTRLPGATEPAARHPTAASDAQPDPAARTHDAAGNPYASLARAGVPLNDPTHHDHPLYAQSAQGVRALDAQLGRASDLFSDQLAAALAVAARRAGLTAVDHVVLSDDATRVFAVQGDLNSPLHRLAYVDTVSARQQTIAQSTAQMAQVEAPSQGPAPQAVQPTPQADPPLETTRVAISV